MVEDFLRFMYVAFSRFESSDQVTVKFSKENIQLLAEISKVSRKLENRISPNEELSSEEFCNKVTPTYLEKVLTNVKSVTKLDYIYNNIYIYILTCRKSVTLTNILKKIHMRRPYFVIKMDILEKTNMVSVGF